MTRNEIIKHYKKYFDLHAKDIALNEEDHLAIDWVESLIESMKEQEKQGKESKVCSCKMSGSCRYEVIMHDKQDECRHKISL